MANNVSLRNAAGATVTAKTTDNAGVHTPHHNVDVIAAGDNNIGNVDIASALPAGTNTIGGTLDAGPGFGTLTRTYTSNADFSTPRAVTAAPASGKKIYATDVIVSGETAALWTVEMETSGNVLAAAYLPANGTAVFTLRGLLVGDANDKKLMVKSSVASKGAVTAVYYSGA